MKAFTPAVFLSAFMALNCHADLILCAPGMSAHKQLTGHSINESIELGKHWRYVITGLEWRLSAGTPMDGKVDGNGDLLTRNNKYFTGSTTMSVYVNNQSLIHGARLTTEDILDFSSGEVTFSSPVVIEGSNIVFHCQQNSNMVNDYGSYVVIKGYSVELPPEPIGSIEGEEVLAVGASHCKIKWNIKRADVRAYAPDLPETKTYTVVEATKTNKGHGNNADGVDADNPGKAAQVWADKGHIISEDNFSGVDNDEGGGNGAAPSH